jgi:hypothetical protein
MITTSVLIQDEYASIEAGVWRKLDSHGEMVYVRVRNYIPAVTMFNIEVDDSESEIVLERKEAIALGHALISLGESL